MEYIREKLQERWKLITFFFILGFLLATIAWGFCIIPQAIDILGFEYPLAFPDCSQASISLCDKYGLEIIEPQGGYILKDGEVRINGTVQEIPPYGKFQLMTIADSNTITYWPQSSIAVDPNTKQWNGVIYSPYDANVAVVALGDNGQILFDFYRRAADVAISQDAHYSGLPQLTTDVEICDSAPAQNP